MLPPTTHVVRNDQRYFFSAGNVLRLFFGILDLLSGDAEHTIRIALVIDLLGGSSKCSLCKLSAQCMLAWTS